MAESTYYDHALGFGPDENAEFAAHLVRRFLKWLPVMVGELAMFESDIEEGEKTALYLMFNELPFYDLLREAHERGQVDAVMVCHHLPRQYQVLMLQALMLELNQVTSIRVASAIRERMPEWQLPT